MTDEAALLAAIIANPDEDTPRLAYADRMDELGEHDRAEFIRVQVQISVAISAKCECGDSFDPTGCHRCRGLARLMSRERDVMRPAKTWWAWYGPGDKVYVHEWRRGFVFDMSASAETWLAHGDAIRGRHPVTRVRLTTGLDWFAGAKDQVVLLEDRDGIANHDIEYTCRRIKYGQWWGMVGTVLEHILAAEWPGVTFELPRPS